MKYKYKYDSISNTLLEPCQISYQKLAMIGSYPCYFCDCFVDRNISEHWIDCRRIIEAAGIKKMRKEKLEKLKILCIKEDENR